MIDPKSEARRILEDRQRAMQDVLIGTKSTAHEYNEEEVKIKFILPLLRALGWNPEKDEVKPEQRTLVGPVDFALRIEARERLFFEVKRLDESLDGYRTVRGGKRQSYAEQAIQYAWHRRIDWVVLTNFKETRLYFSQVRKPEDGLVWKLSYSELTAPKGFDVLWVLSRTEVQNRRLDTLRKRRTRSFLDAALLEDLFDIRKKLVDDLRTRNPGLSPVDLQEGVQRIIDRLLVIRVAEDRGIIAADSLDTMRQAWDRTAIDKQVRTLMKELRNHFRDFDSVYNSKLFDEHPCESYVLTNDVLESSISALYSYNFELIDSDVLGAVYETYLGFTIRGTRPAKDLSHRKEVGAYYTPNFVVEFLIRETLGRELDERWKTVESLLKPETLAEAREEVERIRELRVLDPACGSGSFLIKAFDYLKAFYDRFNQEVDALAKSRQGLAHYEYIIQDVERRIIKDNLFAIDLDPQAAEVASVNLMLKALRPGQRLPLILSQNIRVGNALTGGLPKPEGSQTSSQKDLREFDWSRDFANILSKGGFDVVVGNPPWGADLDTYATALESAFSLARGQFDSYELFIELSHSLLRHGGRFGFIVPDSILQTEHEPLRRFLDERESIETAVKLGEGVFDDVFRATFLLTFRRTPPLADHHVRTGVVVKADRNQLQDKASGAAIHDIVESKGLWIAQSRFRHDPNSQWDIWASDEDIEIREIMNAKVPNWEDFLISSRGVELTKRGDVIACPFCLKWDAPPRRVKGKYIEKTCTHCGQIYQFDSAYKHDVIIRDKPRKGWKPILVGEMVNRYYTEGSLFIDISREGINYKDPELYQGPKLLVRKTGIGIYATIDNSNAYTNQVVFIFKMKPNVPAEVSGYSLELVLAALNSRLMLYYLYKKSADVEWKSFPYVTPHILKQLPLPPVNRAEEKSRQNVEAIEREVKNILSTGRGPTEEADLRLESLVMDAYSIPTRLRPRVSEVFHQVQKLRIIRTMLHEDEDENSESDGTATLT